MDYRKEFEFEIETLKWDVKLAEDNKRIFANYDLSSLSSREKRKIIFDYLVDNSTYDDELFTNIKNHKIRDYDAELRKYADTKNGVCHTMTEYYKMLLGYNNIYSICVVCKQQLKDAPSEGHMLNLVYDDITQSYSFDDITMTVLERDSLNYGYFEHDKYFNYDLEIASQYGQGNEDSYPGEKYSPLHFLCKYPFYKWKLALVYPKYGLENPNKLDLEMPKNIRKFENEVINKK